MILNIKMHILCLLRNNSPHHLSSLRTEKNDNALMLNDIYVVSGSKN